MTMFFSSSTMTTTCPEAAFSSFLFFLLLMNRRSILVEWSRTFSFFFHWDETFCFTTDSFFSSTSDNFQTRLFAFLFRSILLPSSLVAGCFLTCCSAYTQSQINFDVILNFVFLLTFWAVHYDEWHDADADTICSWPSSRRCRSWSPAPRCACSRRAAKKLNNIFQNSGIFYF